MPCAAQVWSRNISIIVINAWQPTTLVAGIHVSTVSVTVLYTALTRTCFFPEHSLRSTRYRRTVYRVHTYTP